MEHLKAVKSEDVVVDLKTFALTSQLVAIAQEVFPMSQITGFGAGRITTERMGGLLATLFPNAAFSYEKKPALIIYLNSGERRALLANPNQILEILKHITKIIQEDKEFKYQINMQSGTIHSIGDHAVVSEIKSRRKGGF